MTALEPSRDEVQALSVVAFRCRRRDHEGLAAWNARTLGLSQAVCARGRVMVSTTRLPDPDGEVVAVRACVLSFRTHAETIAAAIEDITAAAGC